MTITNSKKENTHTRSTPIHHKLLSTKKSATHKELPSKPATTLLFQLFAITAVYLLLSLTVASAATVRIFTGGTLAQTVELSQEESVNRQLTIIHDRTDPTFANLRLSIQVNSASLARGIETVYVYKCKKATPADCAKLTPQVFDNFVDAELLWNDISDKEGLAFFPQVANILMLVKLKDANNRVSWLGFFDTFRRADADVIDRTNLKVQSIDIQAASPELVDPIVSFIQSFNMLPFTWISSATLSSTNKIFGLAADAVTLEQTPVAFQSAVTSSAVISSTTRDFTFVFPNTTSGTADAITINRNPTFTTGDNRCDRDLGETSANSCFDCGCASGQFCAVPNPLNTSQASCQSLSAMTLDILPIVPSAITSCVLPNPSNISIRINNAPPGLPTTLPALLTLNNTVQSTVCVGASPDYNCRATLTPPAACGAGQFPVAANSLNLSLRFQNGPNPSATRDLSAALPTITASFDCGCNAGDYCDVGLRACRTESTIQLSLLSVESFKPIFRDDTTDTIAIQARILNAPTDLVVESVDFSLGNITTVSSSVQGSTGTASCVGSAFSFNCTLPLDIPDYDAAKQYVIRQNTITFNVKFSNVTLVSRALTSRFADITVPSQFCGNNILNPGETPSTCCIDAKCGSLAGTYCDRTAGCQPASNISLTISAATPTLLDDCRIPHAVNITARVNNAPHNLQLSFFTHSLANEVSGFPLDCRESTPAGLGVFQCSLTVPPQSGCLLPSKVLSQNRLNFTISFPNGTTSTINKELSAPFADLSIVPKFTAGDQLCERGLNENETNSCVDCGCAGAPFGDSFFCDLHPTLNPAGTCRDRNAIRLVIDSPTSPLRFDSCETSQTIKVKAHLANQPAAFKIEAFDLKVNGSTTQEADCDLTDEPSFSQAASAATGAAQATPGDAIECTFRVQRLKTCTQNSTHTLSPNNVSLLVSFSDGQSIETQQTVTAALPPIIMTQSIRSIYDIIQQAIADLKQNFQDTKDIIQDLLDWMDTCVTVAVALAFASIAAMIAVPLAAGLIEGGVTWPDALKATGEASRGVFDMWRGVCQMIGETYKLQLTQKEIERQIIETQVCLDVQQHLIDSEEFCKGDESLNCFNQLASCLSRINIQGALNQIDQSINRVGNSMTTIGEAGQRAGKAIGDIFPDTTGALQGASLVPVVRGPNGQFNTNLVCSHTKVLSTTGSTTNTCRPNTFSIGGTIPAPTPSCTYRIGYSTTNPSPTKPPSAQVLTVGSTLNIQQLGNQQYYFFLFCDRTKGGGQKGVYDANDEIVDSTIQQIAFESAIDDCKLQFSNGPCANGYGFTPTGSEPLYPYIGSPPAGSGPPAGAVASSSSVLLSKTFSEDFTLEKEMELSQILSRIITTTVITTPARETLDFFSEDSELVAVHLAKKPLTSNLNVKKTDTVGSVLERLKVAGGFSYTEFNNKIVIEFTETSSSPVTSTSPTGASATIEPQPVSPAHMKGSTLVVPVPATGFISVPLAVSLANKEAGHSYSYCIKIGGTGCEDFRDYVNVDAETFTITAKFEQTIAFKTASFFEDGVMLYSDVMQFGSNEITLTLYDTTTGEFFVSLLAIRATSPFYSASLGPGTFAPDSGVEVESQEGSLTLTFARATSDKSMVVPFEGNLRDPTGTPISNLRYCWVITGGSCADSDFRPLSGPATVPLTGTFTRRSLSGGESFEIKFTDGIDNRIIQTATPTATLSITFKDSDGNTYTGEYVITLQSTPAAAPPTIDPDDYWAYLNPSGTLSITGIEANAQVLNEKILDLTFLGTNKRQLPGSTTFEEVGEVPFEAVLDSNIASSSISGWSYCWVLSRDTTTTCSTFRPLTGLPISLKGKFYRYTIDGVAPTYRMEFIQSSPHLSTQGLLVSFGILSVVFKDLSGNTYPDNFYISLGGEGSTTSTATPSVSAPATDSTADVSQQVASGENYVVVRSAPSPNDEACRTVNFDASASIGTNPNKVVEWDFGDNSPASTGVKVSHTFPQAGDYTVTLKVTDRSGGGVGVSSTQKQTHINVPPVAVGVFPKKLEVGENGIFDARRSYDTPGDTLTFEWDFGDGETAQSAILPHRFTQTGEYRVTLTVSDGASRCNEAKAAYNVLVEEVEVAPATPLSASLSADLRAVAGATSTGSGITIVLDSPTRQVQVPFNVQINGRSTGKQYSYCVRIPAVDLETNCVNPSQFSPLPTAPTPRLAVTFSHDAQTRLARAAFSLENSPPKTQTFSYNKIQDNDLRPATRQLEFLVREGSAAPVSATITIRVEKAFS